MHCPCLTLAPKLVALPHDLLIPSETLSAPAVAICLFSLRRLCG